MDKFKIAFHDNGLTLRGTTVALYDYAWYCKLKFDLVPIIIFNKNHIFNSQEVIEKFQKNFEVFGYNTPTEIDDIVRVNNCEYFFSIKSGQRDGITSSLCKNLIMAVSDCITKNDIHGDKYFMSSPWLSGKTNIDYVPHMINLPDVIGDLREEINIPINATVFGRTGGYETFDIQFVRDVVRDILHQREDYYFLFQNTEKFIEHPRAIFLGGNSDSVFKVKFINTCDAHLHARVIGESFGLTCGEFSVKNKPVITWNGSRERNHIDILGHKALLYNDYTDLINLLLNFNDIRNRFDDWNCYREFLPDPVMEKFKEKYLEI